MSQTFDYVRVAAALLYEHLFGKGCGIEHPGNVGMGNNELFVYIRVSKKQWRGPTPKKWEGFKVTYSFGRGIPRALGNEIYQPGF